MMRCLIDESICLPALSSNNSTASKHTFGKIVNGCAERAGNLEVSVRSRGKCS